MKFNPNMQLTLSRNVDDCYYGDYPTLRQLKEYGENTPSMWVIAQLHNLSEYCNCKDKLENATLLECANIIAVDFDYFKVSEMLLFFYYLKIGSFGRFYGSIDPVMVIASLRKFSCVRAQKYEERENKEKRRKLEEDKRRGITWKEYCELKHKQMLREGKEEAAEEWKDKPDPIKILNNKIKTI